MKYNVLNALKAPCLERVASASADRARTDQTGKRLVQTGEVLKASGSFLIPVYAKGSSTAVTCIRLLQHRIIQTW